MEFLIRVSNFSDCQAKDWSWLSATADVKLPVISVHKFTTDIDTSVMLTDAKHYHHIKADQSELIWLLYFQIHSPSRSTWWNISRIESGDGLMPMDNKTSVTSSTVTKPSPSLSNNANTAFNSVRKKMQTWQDACSHCTKTKTKVQNKVILIKYLIGWGLYHVLLRFLPPLPPLDFSYFF